MFFPFIKVDPPFDAGAPPFFLSFCLLLSNSDISVKNLVWCNLMNFGTGRWGDREENGKRGSGIDNKTRKSQNNTNSEI